MGSRGDSTSSATTIPGTAIQRGKLVTTCHHPRSQPHPPNPQTQGVCEFTNLVLGKPPFVELSYYFEIVLIFHQLYNLRMFLHVLEDEEDRLSVFRDRSAKRDDALERCSLDMLEAGLIPLFCGIEDTGDNASAGAL